MHILGKRVLLRAIEEDDIALIHKWSNDPEIVNGLGDIHFPSSLWHQQRWFERVQKDDSTIRLAIQLHEGNLIGYTGYWNIHWRDRRAEHGIMIGDRNYWGKGFGSEVIRTCVEYGFNAMDLVRLEAYILENNISSRKVYEKIGFKMEGELRSHSFRNGRRINRLIYGLLVEEYKEVT